MNSEDALRAMEDVSIYTDVKAATEAKVQHKENLSNAASFRMASTKIDELRGLLKVERDKNEELVQQNNVAVAKGQAAVLALKDATAEIAALKQISVVEADQSISIKRTKHFNKTVNEFMNEGALKKDPRVTEDMKESSWFVPGLDPENGV